MSTRPAELGEIKEGSNVVIDGEPCRVVEVERSKPGKHGSAKIRLVAIGIFDGVKRSVVGPSDQYIEVPIVEKRSGQVVSVAETVTVMDNETLEMVEVPLPKDEALASRVQPGITVEYWRIMERNMIVQARKE
ncbi:MAG: translation initiation factor IF-5A [Thaumarchaeota archaeon]|nr:translation initiation factor IF-5A [Candidatus Calditenuaceae archaeon]MDW8042239.1 translation initiation factor IF-5A [Nitrososphaerota archaeon]